MIRGAPPRHQRDHRSWSAYKSLEWSTLSPLYFSLLTADMLMTEVMFDPQVTKWNAPQRWLNSRCLWVLTVVIMWGCNLTKCITRCYIFNSSVYRGCYTDCSQWRQRSFSLKFPLKHQSRRVPVCSSLTDLHCTLPNLGTSRLLHHAYIHCER